MAYRGFEKEKEAAELLRKFCQESDFENVKIQRLNNEGKYVTLVDDFADKSNKSTAKSTATATTTKVSSSSSSATAARKMYEWPCDLVCTTCKKNDKSVKVCSRCLSSYYCSKRCQQQDLTSHKRVCSNLHIMQSLVRASEAATRFNPPKSLLNVTGLKSMVDADGRERMQTFPSKYVFVGTILSAQFVGNELINLSNSGDQRSPCYKIECGYKDEKFGKTDKVDIRACLSKSQFVEMHGRNTDTAEFKSWTSSPPKQGHVILLCGGYIDHKLHCFQVADPKHVIIFS